MTSLRAMSGTREKYPEWVVSRTERLVPSRRCKPEALGEDGKRSYSFMQCVNGCGVDVKICSDFLKQHKNQAIEDHLCVCEGLEESDRPTKVTRGGISASVLRDPAKAALVPALHQKCDERYEALAEELQSVKYEVRGVSGKYDMLCGFVTMVFPEAVMPLTSAAQLEQAAQVRFLGPLSTTPVQASITSVPQAVANDLATGDYDLLHRKYKTLQDEYRAQGEQVNRLRNGCDLKMANAFHKREAEMLQDTRQLLEFTQRVFQTMFADSSALSGAELQAKYQPILQKETALHHSRLEKYRKRCARKTAQIPMQGSDSD